MHIVSLHQVTVGFHHVFWIDRHTLNAISYRTIVQLRCSIRIGSSRFFSSRGTGSMIGPLGFSSTLFGVIH
jgi:hypothetical protein